MVCDGSVCELERGTVNVLNVIGQIYYIQKQLTLPYRRMKTLFENGKGLIILFLWKISLVFILSVLIFME